MYLIHTHFFIAGRRAGSIGDHHQLAAEVDRRPAAGDYRAAAAVAQAAERAGPNLQGQGGPGP